MDRIIALMLAVMLCAGLTACGGVSQAEYDKLASENAALQSQIDEQSQDVEKPQSETNSEPSITEEMADKVKSTIQKAFPDEKFTLTCEEYKPNKYWVEIHIVLDGIDYKTFESAKKSPDMQKLFKSAKEMYLNVANTAQSAVDEYGFEDSLAMLNIELDGGYTIMTFSDGKIGVDMTE